MRAPCAKGERDHACKPWPRPAAVISGHSGLSIWIRVAVTLDFGVMTGLIKGHRVIRIRHPTKRMTILLFVLCAHKRRACRQVSCDPLQHRRAGGRARLYRQCHHFQGVGGLTGDFGSIIGILFGTITIANQGIYDTDFDRNRAGVIIVVLLSSGEGGRRAVPAG